MKKPLTIIAIALVCSCSHSRNELMTDLINKKKALEDSIKDVGNYELYYMNRSKEAVHADKDSTVWGALADTSGIYWRKGRDYQDQLKAIEFSIDSLSKMK